MANIEPLIWDPANETLARVCWAGIQRSPELWQASVRTETQGQAWWSDRGDVAFLLWIDRYGLVQVYRFGGHDQTPVERVEDGRRIWNAVRQILENAKT